MSNILSRADDLPKRLRIKAGVMSMGEKIAWGSDTELMYEAANEIERLRNIIYKAQISLIEHGTCADELQEA